MRLALPSSGYADVRGQVQQEYYNGMDARHGIKCVLCFLADGTVGSAAVNYPGAWHDAKVVRFMQLNEKLHSLHQRYRIAADSAFAVGERLVRPPGQMEMNCEGLPFTVSQVLRSRSLAPLLIPDRSFSPRSSQHRASSPVFAWLRNGALVAS